MKPSNHCPSCQNALPEGLPAGRCPHCLLQAATQESAPLGGSSARFVPPSAEDLDAHLDAFDVLELIGRGGMGAVYKAIHLRLDRVVAIKVLPPELAESDPAFGERFLREARALAKLQHPNLVVVHDFGEADGLYFIVMEYVEGPNLRRLIQGGALPPERALEILPQICSGLRYAHSQGLIHRDIKPENILVGDDGRVRITDFGLARLMDPSPADISLTASAQAPGTPHYMAPEQLRDPDNVDHRADIFALGVVFYEMLTGHLPQGRFALPSKEVSVDANVDEVVLRSLEPDPDQRFQQADEVKEALENPAIHAPQEVQGSRDKQETTQPLAKQNLSAGPLFPSNTNSKEVAPIDAQAMQKKATLVGILITLASLLPWGRLYPWKMMNPFGAEGHISWRIFDGSMEVIFISIPLWIIFALGAAMTVIPFLQFRGDILTSWKALHRMSIFGFAFCGYGLVTSTTSWLGYLTAYSYQRQETGHVVPGLGVLLTTVMFFYAWRLFRNILRSEKLLKATEKREIKRRRKANKAAG